MQDQITAQDKLERLQRAAERVLNALPPPAEATDEEAEEAIVEEIAAHRELTEALEASR